MEWTTVLRPELAADFRAAMERGPVIFFTAPCGFGKTTTARALLEGRRVYVLNGGEPGAPLPAPGQAWDVLLADDLQVLPEERQQALCRLIRNAPGRRFVLLSRGAPPGWLLPLQLSGQASVFETQALSFDRQTTGRLLESCGVAVSDLELSAIQKETRGYPLAVSLLARQMAQGAPYGTATADRVRQEIFLYFEEAIYRRLDLSLRRLLLELAPFASFGVELARMVSGDNRAGELLGFLRKHTSMLLQDSLESFRFWPLFRQFLRWELEQEYSVEQQKALYSRGGLYYELREDYGHALACYSKARDHSKVSELLEKNAQLHPGLGHYEEMEPYYHSLPESEILASPALMQGMSMLCALEMDYAGSESWYRALQNFADRCRPGDAAGREARSRLAWLDVALTQRGVSGLIELFPSLFRLLTSREIDLPPFSVTSALPSVMNGGKDFSEWSRIDELLYKTLRRPVEAVLGRDGVGLADLAMAESRFEKGEDVAVRMLSLMGRLSAIRQQGTPDMEFALVGLLARTQAAAGRARDARETLEDLRGQFVQRNLKRFLPNLDAMLCRMDLRLGDMEAVDRWYREKAPRDRIQIHVLRRYRYHTQAMAELALGDPEAALLTLAPLGPYDRDCARHLDGLDRRLMNAVARERLGDGAWKADLRAALDTAASFGFLQPVAGYGGAVLPLLDKCGWTGDAGFLQAITARAREQAACYPDFLRPRREMAAPLSAAERQVLRLICADKSNAEIGEILSIRLATVKTHVSHILKKLGVKRRSEAKTAAERLRLL